ncbi:MAG: hypothetical protein IJS93_02880 [Clostridia bacterium]|nr:hypothetical protein [Clostridia bacterium]
MRKAIFFFITDFKDKLRRKRRCFLSIVPYLTVGIVVGAIVAANVAESDFVYGFDVIFTNEFKPFKLYFAFAGILFTSLLFVYLNSKGRVFGMAFRAVSVYLGYVLGRIAALIVLNGVFGGVMTILFFLLPSVMIIVFCTFSALATTNDRILCGVRPRNNLEVFIPCVKSFIFGLILLLVVELIAGIINLFVNIVS